MERIIIQALKNLGFQPKQRMEAVCTFTFEYLNFLG